MDLEEMKAMWQQQDKLLQENKMLNEKLVTHLLQNKSGNAVTRMLNAEYFGAALCGILTLFLVLRPGVVTVSVLLAISYILSLAFIVASLVLSFYKIKMLRAIDFTRNSVATTAEQVNKFRLFINKERVAGLLMMPVLLITFMAVVTYYVDGQDMYQHFTYGLWRLAIACPLAIAGALILYRTLYFNNIKEINANLEEVKHFKNEH